MAGQICWINQTSSLPKGPGQILPAFFVDFVAQLTVHVDLCAVPIRYQCVV